MSAPGGETHSVHAITASPGWVFLETGALCPWPFLQVEVIKKAYMQGEVEFEDGENGEDGAASPRNVGHNIYILAHQVLLLLSSPATFGARIPIGFYPSTCFSFKLFT